MTETAHRLGRLGRPHARLRVAAAALGSVGAALVVAAAGVAFAPLLPAIVAAWVAIAGVVVVGVILGLRAARSMAAAALAPLTEATAGARAGSIVALLGPAAGGAGASTALLQVADVRAAGTVRLAAGAVGHVLAQASLRRLGAGAVIAAVGALLFLATSPGSGRAAAFWHPLRTLAEARAPIRLRVDRLTVRRGDSVTVSVTVPGGARATLWSRGPGEAWRPAALRLDSAGTARQVIGPLDHDLFLRASSGVRKTEDLHVAVSLPAFLSDLAVTARYPTYLARSDEPLLVGSDTIAIPEGTELRTAGSMSAAVRSAAWQGTSGGARLDVAGNRFTGRWTPRTGGTWRLAVTTVDGEGTTLGGDAAPPELHLRVVPDSAPVVSVPVPGADTTLPLSLRQPLVIDVRDDHGLSSLSIVSWRISQTGKVGTALRESLSVSGVGDRAIVQGELNAVERGLLPGDTLRFRVEAFDNAPTPHQGRSKEYALRLPSREELRAATREATRDVAAAADSLAASQRSLSDRTADLAAQRSREATTTGRQPGDQSGALPFQATERAGEIAREQAALEQRTRDLARAVDEIARAAQAAGIDDTAFQARLEQVREMLQRAITPELQQRLQALQDALAKLDPEATRQALQRLAEAQQQLREELERSQELFHRAAVEGQLASLAADAKELRDRQREWNRDEARRADSAAAASERQLAARTDSLARGIDQASRDLQPSTAQAPRGDDPLLRPRAAAGRAQRAMQRAATGAQQDDMSEAMGGGQEAEQALDSLPEELLARRDSLGQSWRQEVLRNLDHAMTETTELAERQRQVAAQFQNGEAGPGTRGQEASILEGTQAVERQVREAAGKNALVSPGLQAALGFAQRQMRSALDQVEQPQPNAAAAQALAEDALDALNVTAYALARNRGDVAAAKSGSGFQEAAEAFARMAGQQLGMAGDGQGLLPMMGANGAALYQQLRALAERQRGLAQQLERLRAEGAASAAGPLAQEARSLARQLDAGRLDRQTVERQQRLYRRLLDAGRTLTGPEPDPQQERTSRSARGDSVHLPGVLAPGATGAGARLKYPTWADLNGLTPEQRRLVLEYFRRLNAPAPTAPAPTR